MDADPLEALVLNELKEALQHIHNAQGIQVTTPSLLEECQSIIDEIGSAWGSINDDLFHTKTGHLLDHEEILSQERSRL